MNVSQKAWPFYLLILFLVIGLPSIDHFLKKQHQKDAIEVEVQAEPIVALS